MSTRTCGKVAYKNRGQAERALVTIKRESSKSDERPQRVYLCEKNNGGCGRFHLTSQA